MSENALVLGQNAGGGTADHLHSRTALGTAGPGLSEALAGLAQPEALALEAGIILAAEAKNSGWLERAAQALGAASSPGGLCRAAAGRLRERGGISVNGGFQGSDWLAAHPSEQEVG